MDTGYLGRMDIETEVSIGSVNWHGYAVARPRAARTTG
jgi:hypothetical protein